VTSGHGGKLRRARLGADASRGGESRDVALLSIPWPLVISPLVHRREVLVVAGSEHGRRSLASTADVPL
jgi:hypothetical protein